MASAGGIRMGGVFVEIGADPAKFFSAMNRVNAGIAKMGKSLVTAGAKAGGVGLAMGAPIMAAVRQGAAFESTLLNIRASTGATAGELDQIKAASMDMSKALGVGPTAAAQGMLELLKAGMSLESVLGGAGKSALEFAKVGEMDVSQAAVVMSDAMNVFGVSGAKAANTLSAAAGASSTSIQEMSQAFSMSSAVAGLANQSIDDLSAALAILANNGVKGSDAGTSVKTMLMRLMAPADDAAAALAQVGLSTQSFRGADGKMLPMVEIIRTLNSAMGNLDQTAKDDIFRRIFGADAIRAASILSSAGADGFKAIQDAMASALPVSEKFKTIMSGLYGAGQQVLSALERLSIAISDAVAPALAGVVPFITGLIDGLTNLAKQNPQATAGLAKLAVAAIAVGGGLTGLGLSLQVTSFGLAGVGKGIAFVLAPLKLLGKTALFTGGAFSHVIVQLGGLATSGVGSVVGFAAKSGIALAKASSGFGALAVNAATSASSVAASMTGTALAGIARFAQYGLAAFAQYSAKTTALVAITAAQAGAMGTAQVATTVSVVAATVARAAEGNMRAAAIGVQALARLGVAGTTNALIAGAQVARLSAEGATQLLRLGASGTTALATIGTTAVSVGATASGSLVRAASGGGAALTRLGTSGAGGMIALGSAAVRAGSLTLGALIKAATVGVAQAAAMTAAWVGGLAKMSLSAALSGAAMAVAFVAPFAAIGAAIAGAIAVAYAFREQLSAAFGGVGALAMQAAGAIGQGFSTAIADAGVVFGDLYSTASTTFSGIYDAIAAGDLSGAMDVLWAGLLAGWLRGTEAIMSYVDPWIATFQNAFTILGAGIYKTWDGLWVSVGNAFNIAGAYLQGAMDNIINPILASWDVLEAGIRKAWIRVSGIFKDGEKKKAELEKVDAEMRGRAEKRAKDRPGVTGRVAKAQQENAAANADLATRNAAVDANTQATMDDRNAATDQAAADRRAATVAAEQRLGDVTTGQAEGRAMKGQVDDLLAAIRGATSVDQLAGEGGLGDQFQTLRDLGRLTSVQETAISEALDKAAEGLTNVATGEAKAGGVDPAASVAPPDTRSKADVVGTFSSMNLGGLGYGSSLAERTAKAAEETAKNTRKIGDGDKVAA
jgi:TP901 family phage tail tape measure protein